MLLIIQLGKLRVRKFNSLKALRPDSGGAEIQTLVCSTIRRFLLSLMLSCTEGVNMEKCLQIVFALS